MALQAQINNEAALEITLKMAMEPELRLKFSSYTQYCDWRAGLELIRQLLEQPSHPLGENAPENDASLFAGVRHVPHGLLRTLLLERLVPGECSAYVAIFWLQLRSPCVRLGAHRIPYDFGQAQQLLDI